MQVVGNYTFVMSFSGPGSVTFNVTIKEGTSQMSELLNPWTDLIMTQEPEMMVKMRAGMVKPPLVATRPIHRAISEFQLLKPPSDNAGVTHPKLEKLLFPPCWQPGSSGLV